MRMLLLILALIPAMALAEQKPVTVFVISDSSAAAAKSDIQRGLPGSIVEVFKSWEDAAPVMAFQTPDIVVVGSMNRTEGKDKWRTLAEVQKIYPILPVILATENDPEKIEQKLRGLRGAKPDAVVDVPIRRGELSAAIIKVLKLPATAQR